MPKSVNTLWFETLSPWHQPFIDTPFCQITPRQFVLLSLGALIGYAFFKALSMETSIRIAISSIPFIFAISIAFKKIKTVPPEKYLLFLIVKNRKKDEVKEELNRVEKGVPEEVKRVLNKFAPPSRAISIKLSPSNTVEITGILRNPKTNAPMLNTLFYASIGGLILSGRSDEKGSYKIKLRLEAPGSYYMTLAVQGFEVPVDSILINAMR